MFVLANLILALGKLLDILLSAYMWIHACPNDEILEPCNMAKILTLEDIVAFFDLNLNFLKSHTFAPQRKEMAYEFWSDNIFSTYGVCTDV
jgi:hypothetical protein